MSGGNALVVTSSGAPAIAVVPVLAALESTDLSVRAIDAGRLGASSGGTVERLFRAVVGELGERRVEKELAAHPPDVVVTFEAGPTAALCAEREKAARPAPVVAVCAELAPSRQWATTDADRYLVIDDEAAVALADVGVAGERIIVVGPMCEHVFAAAAARSRDDLKRRFKLGGKAVVVEVGGLGYEQTSSIALQLSLTGPSGVTYLFDAGSDNDAAMALRSKVPTLDIRAKMFGSSSANAPLLWRCADAVIARPSDAAIMRALMVGGALVSFMPEGSGGEDLARAVEARGVGTLASSALLLSSALEPLLRASARRDAREGTDGAGNAADCVWVVARDSADVLDERTASARAATRERIRRAAGAAEAAARAGSAPGDLEDLSGGGFSQQVFEDLPDEDDLGKLRAEVNTRMAQVSKTVSAAREAAEQWEKRGAAAAKKGDEASAREYKQKADDERARMHAALAEMAELEKELKHLEKAAADAASAPRPRPADASSSAAGNPGSDAPPRRPPRRGPSVDDMLDDLKEKARSGGTTGARGTSSRRKKKRSAGSSIDDELAALKRKMSQKKKS